MTVPSHELSEVDALLSETHHGDAVDQRIQWDYNSWLSKLASGPYRSSVVAALEALEDAWAQDRGISRAAVVRAGEGDHLRLLVASMAWGYGDRPYGPARVERMLATKDLPTVLREIASQAAEGAEAGLRALFAKRRPRVTNLSVAMGSKFLYFAAREQGATVNAPLIYDQNVYWALTRLTGGKPDAPNPRGHVSPEAYADVVRFIGNAAERFNLEPEDAEYALFHGESWLRRRRRLDALRNRQ